MLTDDQKLVWIKTAKQLLKMVPKFNQRQFATIADDDGRWVHHLFQTSKKNWK